MPIPGGRGFAPSLAVGQPVFGPLFSEWSGCIARRHSRLALSSRCAHNARTRDHSPRRPPMPEPSCTCTRVLTLLCAVCEQDYASEQHVRVPGGARRRAARHRARRSLPCSIGHSGPHWVALWLLGLCWPRPGAAMAPWASWRARWRVQRPRDRAMASAATSESRF